MDYMKPELLVASAALYFVGMWLKKTRIKNKYISFILSGIGIVLATLYVCATSDISTPQNVFMGIFAGIAQGIVCAGMSVYANQLIKRSQKEE